MITTGGGMGGLPQINSPQELVVLLVIVGVLIWLGYRFFSN